MHTGLPALSARKNQWLRQLYICLMGFLLLEYLWRMVSYDGINADTPNLILLLRAVCAFLGVSYGRTWRNRPFRWMLYYLLLISVRLVIRARATFYFGLFRPVVDLFWIFGGCYSLGVMLNETGLKKFWLTIGIIWTVFMMSLALLGIYAAWMRVSIPNLSRVCFIRLWGEADQARLKLIYVSTTSGSLMSLSVMVALLCKVSVRRTWIKVLYTLSVVPMLLALGLIGARTAEIGVSTGIAALSMLRYAAHEQRLFREHPDLRPGHWIVPALRTGVVFLLVFAAVFLGVRQMSPLFDLLKQASQSWPFLRSAAGPVQMADRTLLGSESLTGRDQIWLSVFRFLCFQPKYLLMGQSVWNPMEEFNLLGILSYSVYHCHNMMLQIVFESGIPGLLIVLMMMYLLGRQSLNHFRNHQRAVWLRISPALLAMVCVEQMAECIAWSGFPHLPVLAFFFTTAGLTAAGTTDEVFSFEPIFRRRYKKVKTFLRKCLVGLLRFLRRCLVPIAALVFLLVLLLPAPERIDCPVIRQDDYDDPQADLYYDCGDPDCDTHNGSHTIRFSGCGPCAIANAVCYMTGEQVDVHDVTAFARENDLYIIHQGSRAALYQAYAEACGEKYHFRYVDHFEDDMEKVTDYLRRGCVVLACAANEHGGGHILVFADYIENTGKYLILDSAGNYRSWSRSFSAWQTIRDNRPEKNPYIHFFSFWVYASDSVNYYGY